MSYRVTDFIVKFQTPHGLWNFSCSAEKSPAPSPNYRSDPATFNTAQITPSAIKRHYASPALKTPHEMNTGITPSEPVAIDQLGRVT